MWWLYVRYSRIEEITLKLKVPPLVEPLVGSSHWVIALADCMKQHSRHARRDAPAVQLSALHSLRTGRLKMYSRTIDSQPQLQLPCITKVETKNRS